MNAKVHPAQIAEEYWSDLLADEIVEYAKAKAGIKITWLNHYSALQARNSLMDYSEFDLIGIDGILLRRLAATTEFPRTSADLVMPRVLERDASLRIGIIGGQQAEVDAAAETLRGSLLSDSNELVYVRNGYGDLPTADEIMAKAGQLDLLVVGLGAPKQDEYALTIANSDARPHVILTCGGWLDQVSQSNYYPDWAYKYHMNWAIRLVREPSRLWRRYTLDVARAVSSRANTQDWLSGLPGITMYQKLLSNAT